MRIPDINEQRTPLCRVTAGEQLDAAWDWLCDSRKDAPANADIWHLRHHWQRTRDALLTRLLSGTYRLQPMLLTKARPPRERQVMWGAQDALVLKWTALLITPHLDLHPRCEHVKGHGGGPQSVRRMHDALTTHKYTWVCRTDVKGYYRHINKDRLMNQVKQHITDPVLQGLLHQYLHYTVEDGGEFHTPETGIARGCALSPLMGALHLHAMDTWFGQQMEQAKKNGKPGIYYARYMDDVVILAHTRWQLRKQVRALNQFFNEAGFCQHPDKTFIGRTARGYDWMGAQMSDVGVEGIAHRARANHLERLRRLYEQVRRWPAARRRARMSQYRKRWKIWAGTILLAQASVPVHASIGSSSDMDAGFRACIANGSLTTQANGTWGGTCSIDLPSRGFTPQYYTAHGVIGFQKSGGVSAGGLYATNLDPKDVITLKLNSNYTFKTDAAAGNTTTGSGGIDAGTTFTAGTTPTFVAGNIPYTVGMNCNFLKVFTTATGPNDEENRGGNDTYPCTHSIPGGTLTWTLSRTVGGTVKYPTLNLNIRGHATLGNVLIGIGVGGNGGVDPNPVNPPVAGDPPNCTAITGVTTGPYDFGNGTAGTAAGKMTTSKTVAPHTLSLSCNAGPNGSVEANATLYVQSSATKSADNKTLMASASDWLGLRLKLPASTPAGNGKVASGQTLGDYVVWSGANATPIWTWSMAGESTVSGNVPTTPFTLTPEIYQLQATPGTQDGLRTYTVAYSAVIQ
ncbi:Group II intron-encoded protein LtrA [compost metagenome]